MFACLCMFVSVCILGARLVRFCEPAGSPCVDRGGYPVTKLFSCHTSSTTNIPLCAEKLGESGMHMHAPQTHARHEKSTCTWCHFFSMKMAHCPACTEATAGSLLAWPCDASWRLQRLHGSTCLAAASQAAIAAVPRPWPPRTLHLLLLGGCFRRPSERPERARARPPPATQAFAALPAALEEGG